MKTALRTLSVSFLFTGARFAGRYYRAYFGKGTELSGDIG